MKLAALLLCAANLLLIAALPRTFFRSGRLNAAWWATAAPFTIAGFAVCATAAGLLDPVAPAATALPPLLASLLAGASITIIGYTIGTHAHMRARPVSLWHQDDDTPGALVTRGAYARVRHPFYAAFLLTLAACFAAAPHALTLIALGWGIVQLDRTARREERRLVAAFGEAYRCYMRRTGRFVPHRTRKEWREKRKE